MDEPFPFSQCTTVKEEDLDSILGNVNYVMEPKIDGWRIQMFVDQDFCRVWTRTAHDATGKLLEAEDVLMEFSQQQDISMCLDGEVVFMRGLEPDFNMTARIMGSSIEVAQEKAREQQGTLTFFVFDVLKWDGRDMRGLPWDIRTIARQQLADNVRTSAVQHVPYSTPSIGQHEFNIKVFGEGSILKLRAAHYMGKRNKAWQKWKQQHTADVVIMDFKPGEGKYTGQVGAVGYGQYKWDNTLVHRGYCSGMTDEKRAWITAHQEELIGCVLEVKHYGPLAEDGFRHPQWIRIRPDKLASECLWD